MNPELLRIFKNHKIHESFLPRKIPTIWYIQWHPRHHMFCMHAIFTHLMKAVRSECCLCYTILIQSQTIVCYYSLDVLCKFHTLLRKNKCKTHDRPGADLGGGLWGLQPPPLGSEVVGGATMCARGSLRSVPCPDVMCSRAEILYFCAQSRERIRITSGHETTLR